MSDMATIVDLYINVMQDNKSFDDAGYASNWEGAAKRVSSELGACFEYGASFLNIFDLLICLVMFLFIMYRCLCCCAYRRARETRRNRQRDSAVPGGGAESDRVFLW